MADPPSRYEAAMEELRTASDRSLAIVGAAFVEDSLAFAIRQAIGLVEGDPRARALFHHQGPLGTYSAKITMAHALDLIGDNTKHELAAIGRIRNLFAHHLDYKSFEKPEIADRCAALGRRSSTAEPKPRDRFRAAAVQIAHALEIDALLGGQRDAKLD